MQRLHDPLVDLAVRANHFPGVGGEGRHGVLQLVDCRLKRGGFVPKAGSQVRCFHRARPTPLAVRNFSRQSVAEMRATPL
jgi:hypothetical protein